MDLTNTIIVSVAVALIYTFIIKPKKDKKAAELKENPTPGKPSFIDEYGVKFSGDKQTLIKAPSNLNEYSIPVGVSDIQEGAFVGCAALSRVNLGTVHHIGDGAFQGCAGLKDVGFPKNIVSIGARAFKNCLNLEEIVIPEGVKTIGNSAFEHCVGLRAVTLPKSIKKIGEYAFAECDNLSEIRIPAEEAERIVRLLGLGDTYLKGKIVKIDESCVQC